MVYDVVTCLAFGQLSNIMIEFLISNFRRVLNAVCFLLGYSPASEFDMPTFRNILFRLHRWVGMKNDWVENVGVFIRGKVWLENSLSQMAWLISGAIPLLTWHAQWQL